MQVVPGHAPERPKGAKWPSWPDDVNILDDELIERAQVSEPSRLTDIYLLALALKHGGHLVTFDRSTPWRAQRAQKPPT